MIKFSGSLIVDVRWTTYRYYETWVYFEWFDEMIYILSEIMFIQ